MGYVRGCLSALLVVCLTWPSAHVSAAQPKSILAYYESSGSSPSLQSFYGFMNQLATDTFSVDARGTIAGDAPQRALLFARSKGMATFATVSNFGASGFDPRIVHAIVSNSATEMRTIVNLLHVVAVSGYSGINVDFESISRTDRAAYSAFIATLGRAMRVHGYRTVVSVPAELKDDPTNSWTGAFDFTSLGRSVDVLQLMTYDENGPWGPPGPVAGFNWVMACVRYTVSVVPAPKISLGLPAYGYDWDTTHGTGVQIAWKNIPALLLRSGAAPQWDDASSSPFFSYQTPNGARYRLV